MRMTKPGSAKPLTLRRLATVVLVLGTTSCGDPTWLQHFEVDIVPDSTTYHLQYLDGFYYWIDMKVTVTNCGSRAIYLHRHCGTGESPQRHITGAVDAEMAHDILVGTPCQRWADRLPVELLPGATYEDSLSPMSVVTRIPDPAGTMGERTGSFRLEYFIQSENRVEGWDAVALLPLEQRLSAIFTIVPP